MFICLMFYNNSNYKIRICIFFINIIDIVLNIRNVFRTLEHINTYAHFFMKLIS